MARRVTIHCLPLRFLIDLFIHPHFIYLIYLFFGRSSTKQQPSVTPLELHAVQQRIISTSHSLQLIFVLQPSRLSRLPYQVTRAARNIVLLPIISRTSFFFSLQYMISDLFRIRPGRLSFPQLPVLVSTADCLEAPSAVLNCNLAVRTFRQHCTIR